MSNNTINLAFKDDDGTPPDAFTDNVMIEPVENGYLLTSFCDGEELREVFTRKRDSDKMMKRIAELLGVG